ncbi:MAG: hypothetical protein GF311_13600 [Candidatus Lokiarchaeota archaeon]|nr:hypothetical protein [Candidatus Lokiarchaeota archaeon]
MNQIDIIFLNKILLPFVFYDRLYSTIKYSIKFMFAERYLEAYDNYKAQDYDFHSIKDKNDINAAITNKKIIVMPFSTTLSSIYLILSVIFLFMGILIALILGLSDFIAFYLPIIIFGIFSLLFIILSMWERREAFLIYGAEGIILKDRGKPPKEYTWEELKLAEVPSVYYLRVGSVLRSNIVKINFKDGNFFEIDPFNFKLKEFAEFDRSQDDKLKFIVIECFKSYYKAFRKGKQQRRKHPQVPKNLAEIYRDYKRGDFQQKSYTFFQDLEDSYYNGDSLIFHGKPHRNLMIIMLDCWFLGALMIFLTILSFGMNYVEFIIIYYIILSILFFTLPSFMFVYYRYVILINSKGFCFRKLNGFRYIPWKNVRRLYHVTRRASSKVVSAVILRNGNKLRFSEIHYNLEKFPKQRRGELFFLSFKIFHTLSMNKDLI